MGRPGFVELEGAGAKGPCAEGSGQWAERARLRAPGGPLSSWARASGSVFGKTHVTMKRAGFSDW